MKMKKTIALFAAVSMVLAISAGCNKKTESDTSSLKKGGYIKDLKGYNFVIAKASYGETDDWWYVDNSYGEAIKEAFQDIRDSYNCEISTEYYEPTKYLDTARAAIMSGEKFADLMVSNLFSFGPLYANDLLTNIKDVPHVDLTSKSWIKAFTDVGTFKDGVYGICSEGMIPTIGMTMFYNKTLLKKLNLQDPVELVRKGEWTWDKLREMSLAAAKDLDNDGKFTSADRWGCTSVSYDGLTPLFMTSGIQTIKKNAENKLLYNLDNKEAETALVKFSNLLTTSDGVFFSANHDFTSQFAQYTSGKALFCLGNYYKWKDMEDENEEIPLPKYSKDSQYSAPVYHNAMIMSIPKTIDDPETTGYVLQLLADKTAGLTGKIIEEEATDFQDRDTHIEMKKKYVEPYLSVDLLNISQNSNDSISNATIRAICNPIFFGESSARFISGYGEAAQKVLDDMFNN